MEQPEPSYLAYLDNEDENVQRNEANDSIIKFEQRYEQAYNIRDALPSSQSGDSQPVNR